MYCSFKNNSSETPVAILEQREDGNKYRVITQVSDVAELEGKRVFLDHFLPKRKFTKMRAVGSVDEDYLKG